MNSTSVLLTSMSVQMKQTFARNMFKFTLFVGPFLITVILGEMFKHSTADNFVAYVVLGSGLWNLWNCIAFSSAGDINRERYNNTLSIIFSAPADFRLILLGKILGNTLLALCSFFLSVFFATVFYRHPIIVTNWPLLIMSLLLAILAFIIMSIFIAYLLTLSRKTAIYMNCLEIPVALICGFVFPIENLPQGVQFISWIFPPTWAVRLIRLSVTETTYGLLENFVPLIITSVIFVILATLLYRIIFKQVKVLGTLDMA
ncbi:MAG: ABC transporter permease [Oscillospiraceae bacterium]|nr:ABC transporter permease [Oscillospiraceae bacterium]MCL2277949.1 ABC transporter permease [Oscillospiraceae bacterium]